MLFLSVWEKAARGEVFVDQDDLEQVREHLQAAGHASVHADDATLTTKVKNVLLISVRIASRRGRDSISVPRRRMPNKAIHKTPHPSL